MAHLPNHPSSNPAILWTSSDVLAGISEVAAGAGIRLDDHLRRNGISPETLASAQGLLPFQSVTDLLEDIAESENRRDFGFLLGKAQKTLQFGLISQLPLICPDVRTAFETFFRYQQLYSQSSHWHLLDEGDIAYVRRQDVSLSARARPQLVMLSLTLAFRSARVVVGETWSPFGIYVDNDAYSGLAEMRRFFGAPVFFNSVHNEIAFPADLLHLPIRTSDPPLLKVLTRHLDQLLMAAANRQSFRARVFDLVRSALGDSRCTLEWVAGRLHMHPRTVQRMLAEEGTGFRDLLRDARIELADYLLRLARMPIGDISDMLGYANTSAFTRAYEKARGQNPSRVRREARKQSPS